MRSTRRIIERGCRVLLLLLVVIATMTASPVTRAQPAGATGASAIGINRTIATGYHFLATPHAHLMRIRLGDYNRASASTGALPTFAPIAFPHPPTLAGSIGIIEKVFPIHGTGDLSLIPPSSNMILQPLPARQVRVSAWTALRAAQAAWGLTADEVDLRRGIVRAVISMRDDALHQDLKAWLVVAKLMTWCPAPGCNTMYSKMVIVVDARTGKVLFSYPADPTPIPAPGPPPTAMPVGVPAMVPPPVTTIVSLPAMGPPPTATPASPGTSPIGRGSARPTPTAPPPPTPQTPGPWMGSGPAPTPTPTFRP